MKKLTAFLLSILLLLSLTACGGTQNTQTSSESGGKVFVVYFSASGNTERVAREIAAVTDGTLFALTPTEPYTTEDLNWSDADSRVSPASASPTVPMRRRSGLGSPVSACDISRLIYPIGRNAASQHRGRDARGHSVLCLLSYKRKKPPSGNGRRFFSLSGHSVPDRRLNYSSISMTTPEPTVRPPSRIAKRRPCSIAMGVISSTFMSTLSPGMHISVPSGRVMTPVTSVVRK